MEKPSFSEKERPRMAWVLFGAGGHEGEYVLNLEGFNSNRFIPLEIESGLRKELGEGWDVSNRGTRIEILCKKEYGRRDDEKVLGAIKKALTPHGYLLKE